MKRLVVLLILVIARICGASGQNVGLGQFVINKTKVDIIKKLADSLVYNIVPVSEGLTLHWKTHFLEFKQSTIYQIIKDTVNAGFDIKSSFIGKVFYIDTLTIGPIKIQGIYLTFFRDTLISFYCKETVELDEALTFKYGMPTSKRSTKTIYCVNGLGLKIEHEEETFTADWKVPDNYSVFGVISDYYDDDCKKSSHTIFNMSNRIKEAELNVLDNKMAAGIEARAKKRKYGGL